MKALVRVVSVLAIVAFIPGAQAATYKIDADHSSVEFKVKHLLSKVSGSFTKFEGTPHLDAKKLKSFKASAKIDAASIDTRVEKRDEHLRSADFFDTAKYPSITFESTNVKRVKGNMMEVHGNLTMHGVTKPIVMNLEFLGTAKDPWGNEKAAFSGSAKINRKDFGLGWNKVLETGGVLVGETVEITVELEANLTRREEKEVSRRLRCMSLKKDDVTQSVNDRYSDGAKRVVPALCCAPSYEGKVSQDHPAGSD